MNKKELNTHDETAYEEIERLHHQKGDSTDPRYFYFVEEGL